MKIICKTILFIVLVLALASCNTLAPKPTETPVPTETSVPTSTTTPEPTLTPTPTSVPPTETPTEPVLKMPTGKPDSKWEGFPIMPGAIAGEGDSKGYSFTIKASAEEIQNFYEKELNKLGWNLFANGNGDSGTVLLIFMKGTDTFTVSIIAQPDEIMYVLLVK